VVLRPHERGVRAHGTPWHGWGRYASTASAPLAAVFFIHHARASVVHALGVPEATGLLFARAFPPPWDARGIAAVLRTCQRVSSHVPCFTLGFTPDATAVEAVERALGATRSAR
jgi:hypothetical protein